MSERLHDAQDHRGAVWPHALITLLRVGFAGGAVPLMVAIGLSGCARARSPVLQPQGSAATAAPAKPAVRAYATIAAVRPIHTFETAGSDPDSAILPAMGVSSAPAAGGASSEVVVRTDKGDTLSVVQPNAADFTPGERVMIVPGGLTRLAPSPPQS